MVSSQQETVPECDVSNITNLEETCSKVKEIEILKVCELCPKGKFLHVHLEQKADLAVREEWAAQRRLSEAEADMETRKWKKRSSVMTLYETSRELEAQRLELYHAHHCVDQAQRDKIN